VPHDTFSDGDRGGRAWRGLASPRSASGRSALVEPLPHHISCDALHVSFRADPQRIARLLPPGLEPLESGEGWVMIAEMTKVSAADPDRPWREPARANYNECVLGFYCRFGERLGRYSALVWVDRDWSMGMGPIFGWSKRLSSVDRTRLHPLNPGHRTIEEGTTLGGTVSRLGRPVLSLSVTFAPGTPPLDRLPGHSASTFLYRYVASPSPDVADVEQLFELPLSNLRTSPVQVGSEASIETFAASDEEVADLGSLEVTAGYAYQRGWTTDRVARLLKDYATP